MCAVSIVSFARSLQSVSHRDVGANVWYESATELVSGESAASRAGRAGNVAGCAGG